MRAHRPTGHLVLAGTSMLVSADGGETVHEPPSADRPAGGTRHTGGPVLASGLCPKAVTTR